MGSQMNTTAKCSNRSRVEIGRSGTGRFIFLRSHFILAMAGETRSSGSGHTLVQVVIPSFGILPKFALVAFVQRKIYYEHGMRRK